jgi:hypothetical protein
MFGFRRTPRWALEIIHKTNGWQYSLESDSIGKLLGYISHPLEEGRRPSMQWTVLFRNRNGGVFRLYPAWPESNEPVSTILQEALQIDPERVRARSEPDFYEYAAGKKRKRPLEAQIDGKPLDQLPLQERIDLHASRAAKTESVFGIIDRVFDDRVDRTRGPDDMWEKIDP